MCTYKGGGVDILDPTAVEIGTTWSPKSLPAETGFPGIPGWPGCNRAGVQTAVVCGGWAWASCGGTAWAVVAGVVVVGRSTSTTWDRAEDRRPPAYGEEDFLLELRRGGIS